MAKTQLYRHYDAEGRLLYVVISLSAMRRLRQHELSSDWQSDIRRVEIEIFPTRAEAMDAEKAAIKAEKPIYNIAHQVPKAGGLWTVEEMKAAKGLVEGAVSGERLRLSSLRDLAAFPGGALSALSELLDKGCAVIDAECDATYDGSTLRVAVFNAAKAADAEARRGAIRIAQGGNKGWQPDAKTLAVVKADWLENLSLSQTQIEKKHGVSRSTLRRRFGERGAKRGRQVKQPT